MNKIKLILENEDVKQTWLVEKPDKSHNMINFYAQNRCQPTIETLYIQIRNVRCKSERSLVH